MAYERRIEITHSLGDAYKHYKKVYKGKLSEKQYKNIAYELNKTISDMIVRESFEYRIPHGLGFLRIKKKKLKFKIENGRIKINRNIIDWKKTWDYWYEKYPGKTREEIKKLKDKKIYFLTNEHSNGEVMTWYWDRRFSRVKNIYSYSFRTVKGGIIDNRYIGRLGLRDWIFSVDKNNEYYY